MAIQWVFRWLRQFQNGLPSTWPHPRHWLPRNVQVPQYSPHSGVKLLSGILFYPLIGLLIWSLHWGQGISSTAPRNTYKTHLSRLPPALIFNFSYSSSGVVLFSCSGVLIPISYNPDAMTGPIFRKDCKRLISLFRSIILALNAPALYFLGEKVYLVYSILYQIQPLPVIISFKLRWRRTNCAPPRHNIINNQLLWNIGHNKN